MKIGWEDRIWEDPHAFETAITQGVIEAPSGRSDRAKQIEPKPDMHVFVDDSGCPGFKFADGSSTHVVMAAAVFTDPKQIEHLTSCVNSCAEKNKLTKEFKYSSLKERHRDCFFNCTATVRLKLRAITADKRKIYSPYLRQGPPLKSHLLRQLLTNNFGQIKNAKIVIDGQDTRGLDIPDEEYLMEHVNKRAPGTIHSVTFADSKRNRGIQLADMLAGSIGRSVQEGRKTKSSHHRNRFTGWTKPPMGDIWDFTAKS